MAVTANSKAPYAPPTAVMEVINRVRRGLPSPITLEVLMRAGITESLAPRTLQALQILDLVDGDGRTTETLEGLRRAPEPELQKRLTDWLNAAYADVLQYIDPATADEGAIRDAFRNYDPVGQHPRMVTLFMGLYAAAGVRVAEKAASRPPRTASSAPRTVSPRSSTSQRASGPIKLSPGWTRIARNQSNQTPDLPPALAGLMASLPLDGRGWTKEKREQFVTLLGAALDWCFPIVTQDELDADNDENAA